MYKLAAAADDDGDDKRNAHPNNGHKANEKRFRFAFIALLQYSCPFSSASIRHLRTHSFLYFATQNNRHDDTPRKESAREMKAGDSATLVYVWNNDKLCMCPSILHAQTFASIYAQVEVKWIVNAQVHYGRHRLHVRRRKKNKNSGDPPPHRNREDKSRQIRIGRVSRLAAHWLRTFAYKVYRDARVQREISFGPGGHTDEKKIKYKLWNLIHYSQRKMKMKREKKVAARNRKNKNGITKRNAKSGVARLCRTLQRLESN